MNSYERKNAIRTAEKTRKATIDKWRGIVNQVREHHETIILSKTDLPEPWAFVEEMFPSLSERISQTSILKNENTAFAKRIGIPSDAGGLYIRPSSTILVLYNRHFDDDVIVVHELLHLVSRLLGGEGSVAVEEDFAYTKSLPYVLRKNGRKFVLEKYLMPYYSQHFYKKTRGDKSFKDIAEKHCNTLISQAFNETIEVPEEPDLDVFDLID